MYSPADLTRFQSDLRNRDEDTATEYTPTPCPPALDNSARAAWIREERRRLLKERRGLDSTLPDYL
jgi:hypothetical protein